MTPMTRVCEDSLKNAELFVAFELSAGKWKLGFGRELAAPPRIRTVEARDLRAVRAEIVEAKRRLGLSEDCPVKSCYEAGRDGLWLHRWLVSEGISNVIVDPGSIEVERRRRKRKTDRIDVVKLLMRLIRHALTGERVWSVVRVPTEDDEDGRRIHRERERLIGERVQHQGRIRSLLATQGLQPKSLDEKEVLELRRPSDGAEIPGQLRREIVRELDRMKLLQRQIKAVELELKQMVAGPSVAAEKIRRLQSLKAIGMVGAQVLGYEFFVWRNFTNGREVGALAGLTGTPFQSGDMAHEQGISKAGNRRIRAVMTELAWGWIRWQPDSALSQWFKTRFGSGPGRLRRIGIVAVARKLLIALWRFVEHGVVPDGAVMSATA